MVLLITSCGSKNDRDIEKFTELLGGNRALLDGFLEQMETKIAKTYNAKSLTENYNSYLQDILKSHTERKIKYDSLDCRLIYDFEKTLLADKYEFYKYDTVYFDHAIVTIKNNGEEEFEIFHPSDTTDKSARVQYLREVGYSELKELGKLQSALHSDQMTNMEVKEFYRTKDSSCLPAFDDYIRTIYLKQGDFDNYMVKSMLFYEIYLVDIMDSIQCDR